jgi:high-affinity iron transporter
MPIAKFFSSTSYIILILAFVLMGKAVAALQEAAVITVNTFPLNISFDWLGVYPTWQGLSAQLLVLIIAFILLMQNDTKQPS